MDASWIYSSHPTGRTLVGTLKDLETLFRNESPMNLKVAIDRSYS